MIENGKGGTNTKTGLYFEKRVEIKEIFNKLKKFKVKENTLYYKNEEIGSFYKKHKLYKKLLEPQNINYKTLLSKQLLPDDSFFNIKKNTLFIIECKFQKVNGSVDEKLQTCDFKLKQYKKLFKSLNIKVEYYYVLNNWFKKEKYKDTLNYIKEMNCNYFFNEIPLEKLGIKINNL